MQKKGTGGKNKRKLQGKGPTPKAEDRVYHKAYKQKQRNLSRSVSKPKRANTRKNRVVDIIYGKNAVLEGLHAKLPFHQILLSNDAPLDDKLKEIVRRSQELDIPLFESPKAPLDDMTNYAVHQGVVAKIKKYEYSTLDDLITASKDIVILDHITDPTNLGNLARSAAAFNTNIVIPTRRSIEVNATVWKISAGNLAHIKVAQVVNIVHAIEKLKTSGYFVVGLDGAGEHYLNSKLITKSSKIVFVAGNEGSGLSQLVQKSVDIIVKIPTAVESLNVATAVSIALYQKSIQQESN
ncbi:MAG: 23S rRNA (guanosine(2251)-2'-O)-methyltransferase RlmB [Candidatus Ancillula sp.]|jgi:23S rRNA (guanosine2251-2'-O)-methyltransferase|nr:23S rRNA (guanosine(2251)-2'-O)-methyltransferase RlmB [Candidatus Ancillula sp.]